MNQKNKSHSGSNNSSSANSNSTKIKPSIIDDKDKIAAIDQENVLGSIEALADQVRLGWQKAQQLEIKLATKPSDVTIAGMGGSALGADVVKHAFKDELQIPLNIVNDYDLPGYVSGQSLVILSSYSGSTEEILSCAQQAKTKQAQILVITQGGPLAEFAQENNYPCYLIPVEHNPSNQPRMAIGYAVIGLMGLLTQAKLIKVTQSEIEQICKTILFIMHRCQVDEPTNDNPAKTLSYALVDRRPNLVAAEFLTGAAHVASNQFNENAKTFANFYQIPEINHHLLEALQLPVSNTLDNIFIFFNSKLYHNKNQKRMTLTQEAVIKQGIEALKIELETETKLEQIFELITLMSYTNFYLSVLHGINPSEIPMVDWFKAQLKK